MSEAKGAFDGDVLAHPVASIVGKLGGEGDECLATDTLSLIEMAGAEKPLPHQAAVAVRQLREHLKAAQGLADNLPEWLARDLRYVEPSGETLGDLLARTEHKIAAAERVTAAMCARVPSKETKRKNEIRDRVARACAEIFSRRTGAVVLKVTPSKNHREPRSLFGGFVYDVFLTLNLMDTPTAWYRPAEKAAKWFTAKHRDK